MLFSKLHHDVRKYRAHAGNVKVSDLKWQVVLAGRLRSSAECGEKLWGVLCSCYELISETRNAASDDLCSTLSLSLFRTNHILDDFGSREAVSRQVCIGGKDRRLRVYHGLYDLGLSRPYVISVSVKIVQELRGPEAD